MSDPYQLDRLTRLSTALGYLSSALTALKRAHAYIPDGSGDERNQIHALAKLADARRMSVHNRMMNLKNALEDKK